MGKISIHDISDGIAKKHRFSQKDIERFIASMFDVVNEGITKDGLAKVKGLGTFKITNVKKRESINVNTGERVVIDGHGKLTFTADTTMRERINKPFAHFETVPVEDGVTFADVEEDKTANTIAEDAEVSVPVDSSSDAAPQESAVVAEEVVAFEQQDEEKETTENPTQHVVPLMQEENEAVGSVGNLLATEETAPEKENVTEDSVPETDDLKVSEEPVLEKENVKVNDEAIEEKNTMNSHVASIVPLSQNEPKTDDEGKDVPKKTNKGMLITLFVLLGIVLMLGLGYLLGNHRGEAGQEASQIKPVVSDSIQDDTAKVLPLSDIEKARASFNREQVNADTRLKYGAYEIVGVDTLITLRDGQSMKSYCSATLGSGMLVYFQVLNGVDSMKAGGQLLVPKVKVKKHN